tara:strand:+ start:422 stop:1702 length:1281 start_codon:yes stop_codon:yes gene_type:complete
MLHCYKKSRHNLYEQLDYLGLNPYEQRHFCFEGAGSGEGDEGDASGGFDGMSAAAAGASESSSYGGPGDFGSGPSGPDADPGYDGGQAGGPGSEDVGASDVAEAGQSSLATQAQLDAQVESLSARSAAEKAEGLQDLMDMGIFGYNDAVDRGFVDLIGRAEEDFDLSVARSVEDKYGLSRGQVSPAAVGGFSYTGPNSTAAGLSEMGNAARDVAVAHFNAIQSLPTPTGIVAGLLGIDVPAGMLGRGFRSDVLGLNQTSELGKDIAGLVDSLGLPSMPSSLDEAALSAVQAAAEAATDFDLSASAIAEGLFDSVFGTEEESVDDVDSRDSGTGKGNDLGSPSTSVADISSQTGSPEESIDIDLGGYELIPQLTPPVQTASIAAPELTVTPFKRPEQKQASSTNIESILERIYGRKTASELLNRNIA